MRLLSMRPSDAGFVATLKQEEAAHGTLKEDREGLLVVSIEPVGCGMKDAGATVRVVAIQVMGNRTADFSHGRQRIGVVPREVDLHQKPTEHVITDLNGKGANDPGR